jgi:hypothetical protein
VIGVPVAPAPPDAAAAPAALVENHPLPTVVMGRASIDPEALVAEVEAGVPAVDRADARPEGAGRGELGTRIWIGDRVTTGEGAAVLRTPDGVRLRVGAASAVAFGPLRNGDLVLFRGSLRIEPAEAGGEGAPVEFHVRTAAASFHVRGATVDVAVAPDGAVLVRAADDPALGRWEATDGAERRVPIAPGIAHVAEWPLPGELRPDPVDLGTAPPDTAVSSWLRGRTPADPAAWSGTADRLTDRAGRLCDPAERLLGEVDALRETNRELLAGIESDPDPRSPEGTARVRALRADLGAAAARSAAADARLADLVYRADVTAGLALDARRASGASDPRTEALDLRVGRLREAAGSRLERVPRYAAVPEHPDP